MTSKTSIDKAGLVLSGLKPEEDRKYYEQIFDDFRGSHLEPLSRLTLELQRWLAQQEFNYYIAQRLKRKPQIIRKLKRLSVRLTQLQDIGGCRIVVEKNTDLDRLLDFLKSKVESQPGFKLERETDYREKGRDDSGYRAVHLIINVDGKKQELQIRSRVQHYWAENVERTSVVYGHYLKENEGDKEVRDYFKALSDIFYEIESNRTPTPKQKMSLVAQKQVAEEIIKSSDKKKVLNGFVNEGIIKSLIEKEKSLADDGLHNWLIVFSWDEGAFISWDVVERDTKKALQKYVEFEHNFSAEEGFEVVLVGASAVNTIRMTHSHYFGIDKSAAILEDLDESILGFSERMDIDVGARQILECMTRKKNWGSNRVSTETLKNHFCKNVYTFDSSLASLIEKELIIRSTGASVSLNLKKKSEIESYI
jgi:ppGpp synthetase/RelA/SpoT-type nucleotidyltranferase